MRDFVVLDGRIWVGRSTVVGDAGSLLYVIMSDISDINLGFFQKEKKRRGGGKQVSDGEAVWFGRKTEPFYICRL